MTESENSQHSDNDEVVTLTLKQQRIKKILNFAGINPKADTSNLPQSFTSKRGKKSLTNQLKTQKKIRI